MQKSDSAVDADLGAVHSVISVKGTIINSIATTLTIEIGGKFASSVNVKYFEGSTLVATDSSRTVTNGTLTSTVPSAVYGQSVGDTIAIKIESGSSLSANSVNKTVITAPSGGTITTSGDYRIHTFNSSGNFVVATNTMLKNVEYLVIGGGGGGGYHMRMVTIMTQLVEVVLVGIVVQCQVQTGVVLDNNHLYHF